MKRSKKWTHEERKACLALWIPAISPEALARQRRVLAAAGGIKGVDDDEDSADDPDSVQKSFLKIIRLITTSDLPTTQLASFRTTITAMANFSLNLIEKIWAEAANKLELRKAIEFFDHALDVAIQGAGVTVEKDGVWISRMLLAIFALP